jgi:predicted dehydrogenase
MGTLSPIGLLKAPRFSARDCYIWFYGTEGTICVDQQQNIFAGHRGDTQLSAVPNPPEEQAYYRVEEEFTNAIRGQEESTMGPFETGVHYMKWTEAVPLTLL